MDQLERHSPIKMRVVSHGRKIQYESIGENHSNWSTCLDIKSGIDSYGSIWEKLSNQSESRFPLSKWKPPFFLPTDNERIYMFFKLREG